MAPPARSPHLPVLRQAASGVQLASCHRLVPRDQKLGFAPFRIHDLRHTAASMWIAKEADVKVVQRILGHESATMTLDLYGHLWDASLWDAAKKFAHTSHTSEAESQESESDAEKREGR